MKNIILFVVFTLFAAVQLNDPDPLLWVVIYGSVAIAALLAQYAPRLPLNVPILIYQIVLSIYALFYLPSLIEYFAQPNKVELVGQMKAESPWFLRSRGTLLSSVLPAQPCWVAQSIQSGSAGKTGHRQIELSDKSG